MSQQLQFSDLFFHYILFSRWKTSARRCIIRFVEPHITFIFFFFIIINDTFSQKNQLQHWSLCFFRQRICSPTTSPWRLYSWTLCWGSAASVFLTHKRNNLSPFHSISGLLTLSCVFFRMTPSVSQTWPRSMPPWTSPYQTLLPQRKRWDQLCTTTSFIFSDLIQEGSKLMDNQHFKLLF